MALFKIGRVLLFYAGIRFQEISTWSKFQKILYQIYSRFIQALFFSCLILFVVELFRLARVNIQAAIPILKTMPFVVVIITKMIFLQTNKMATLINLMMEADAKNITLQDHVIKKIYKGSIKYCHNVGVANVLCLYLTGISYVSDACYRSYYFYTTHQYANATTEKPHPVSLWFPFDKNNHYNIAMAYQIVHIIQTGMYGGAVQALVISVMVFLKAELRILQHHLRNLRQYQGPNRSVNIFETIKEYVKKHQRIIGWVKDFNDSFQYVMLLEFLVTSFVLAAILIDILQGVKMSFNIVYFTFVTLQLFTVAWNANEIIIESSVGLSNAIYECHWYNFDEQSVTLIKIMIMRCKKPLAVTIGPFGQMTVESAVSRMKLAYSVVSVLSTN